MDELKPCPFCGSEPVEDDDGIGCQNIHCLVQPLAPKLDGDDVPTPKEIWNTRIRDENN